MKQDLFIKLVLIFTAVYFLGHIGYAMADTVIITTPSGDIKPCIITGGYITCF